MIHFKCFVLVDPVVGVVALLAILVVALFGSNFGFFERWLTSPPQPLLGVNGRLFVSWNEDFGGAGNRGAGSESFENSCCW